MKNLKPFLLSLMLCGVLLLPVLSLTALGQTVDPAAGQYGLESTALGAGLKRDLTIPQYLGMIAGAALAMAGSVFLFLIIYGGVMIMTSAGSDRVEKGKKIITWAVIGAIVLGASYAITSFIFSALTTSVGE